MLPLNSRRFNTPHALFLCLLALATAGASKRPRRLMNTEYRFSVEVPSGAVGCTEGLHGFSILLNPHSGGCESSSPQAHVGVFGDYNTEFRATPLEALRDICPRRAVWADKSGLRLTFPGRASAVCRKDSNNGWVDIYVTAQAGLWGKGFGRNSSAPYIDYTAQLHTRASSLASDLKLLRRVLATVRFGRTLARGAGGQVAPR